MGPVMTASAQSRPAAAPAPGAGADDLSESDLAGRFLVAAPAMADENFRRALIYVCGHGAEGSMGLVVNRDAPEVSFAGILRQLGIEASAPAEQIRVQSGGPVATGRGFVLHSDEYLCDSSLNVAPGVAMTNTVDILRAMALGAGPERSFLALGYAGWGQGQLRREIEENAWLVVEGDPALLFDVALEDRWAGALARLGFTPERLSPFSGSA